MTVISQKRIDEHRRLSGDLWQNLERAMCATFENPSFESTAYWRVFTKLLEEAWKELAKIECAETEWRARQNLTKRFSELLEKVLDSAVANHYQLSAKHPNYFAKVIGQLTQLISTFAMKVFITSATLLPRHDSQITALIHIFDKAKKLVDINHQSRAAGSPGNLLEKLNALHAEGVDQCIERVFETNHP